MKKTQLHQPEAEDTPPIMGTWRRFYWLVMILHAIFILLFYLITKRYS
jgi:hypothetical protein